METESNNAYEKSIELGLNPNVRKEDGKYICLAGEYDELIITDCTNCIEGNIKANKVTFIGNQALQCYDKYGHVKIKCDYAEIYNENILNNLGNPGSASNRVEINAKVADILYTYTAEDIMLKVYKLLHDYIANKRATHKITDTLYKIKIHLDETDEVWNIVEELNTKLTSELYIGCDEHILWILSLIESLPKFKDRLMKLGNDLMFEYGSLIDRGSYYTKIMGYFIDNTYSKYVQMDGNFYIARIGDKNIKINRQRLIDIILNDYICVHNLNDTNKVEIKLETSNIIVKASNNYNKSLLLGTAPQIKILNGINVCIGEKRDELCITDYTRHIDGNLTANKITFIGEKELIGFSTTKNYIIECNKAIIDNNKMHEHIKNMGNYIKRIALEAEDVVVKHGDAEKLSPSVLYKSINSNKKIKCLCVQYDNMDNETIDKLKKEIDTIVKERELYINSNLYKIVNRLKSDRIWGIKEDMDDLFLKCKRYISWIVSMYSSLEDKLNIDFGQIGLNVLVGMYNTINVYSDRVDSQSEFVTHYNKAVRIYKEKIATQLEQKGQI